jgi:hypothetical protein
MINGNNNESKTLNDTKKNESGQIQKSLIQSPLIISSLELLLSTYESLSTRVCAAAIFLLTTFCCYSLSLLPLLVQMLHDPGCLLVRGLIADAVMSIGSLGIETLLTAVQGGRDADLESFILTVMANHPAIIRLVLVPFVIKEMRYGDIKRKVEMAEILERIQNEVIEEDEGDDGEDDEDSNNNNNNSGNINVDNDDNNDGKNNDASVGDDGNIDDDYDADASTKKRPEETSPKNNTELPPSLVRTRAMVLKELYNCLLLVPDDRLRSAMHLRSMGVDGEKILIKLLNNNKVNFRVRVYICVYFPCKISFFFL